MSDEKPIDKKVKTWGERLRALQGVGWIITVIVGFFFWYTERVKVRALTGSGYMTKEDVQGIVAEESKKDSTRTERMLDSRDAVSKKRAEDFVKTYVQPMLNTDKILEEKTTSFEATLRAISSGQANVSRDVKAGLLQKAKEDSITAENAKLRAMIQTQQTVDEIIERINEDTPAKKRRDKIE